MHHRRFGIIIAAVTAALTLVTFAISVSTLPLSGPFCAEDCFSYPYRDIAARFPRDYYWMLPAGVLGLLAVALTIAIAEFATEQRRMWGRMAVVLAAMGAVVLLIAYFVQLAVIQPSLLAGEADGIALLTQFNPHGVFIALEELGYLLLAGAMSAAAIVPQGASWGARLVRWAFGAAAPLAVAAFVSFSVAYGIHREYLFEVAVISIFWLLLFPGSIGWLFLFRGVPPARTD
jgi:hypothetical protein